MTIERFSRGQTAALTALVASPSIRAAAESAGVGVSTLRRWLTEPAFQTEHRRLARECQQEAVSVVLAAQREAVLTLIRILRSSDAHASLRAAVKLLELGQRLGEDDLDQRVLRLEAIHLESLRTKGGEP